MASSESGSMSASSEIIPVEELSEILKKNKHRAFEKKMCAASETFGIMACTEIESLSAAYIRDSPLYAIIGKHAVSVVVSPVAGPVIEKIEIEIQVGDKAVEKIIKVINLSEEEETLEDKNVLMRLKDILVPGLKNRTSSSSSSSRSSSSRSSSSSKLQSSSSSSSKSSSSSSRQRSKMVDDVAAVGKNSKRVSRRSSSSSSSQSGLQSRSSSSRSSSSSSSRSSALSKQELYDIKFTKNHIHQHALSTSRPTSRSSAYSFEAIYNKAKYLANTFNPTVTILIRAVRADHKLQGYQIAAYVDKVTSRLQIIFANLVENDNWRICADGVILSNHKLMTKIAWGIDCKQYETEIIAETGLVGQVPAFRLKVSWEKLPKSMKHYAKKLTELITQISQSIGINQLKAKNVRNQIKLTIAIAKETTLDVVLKTPKRTIYKVGMDLPVSLPIGDTAAELEIYQESLSDKIVHLVTKANAAVCSLVRDTVITFNNRKYKNEMPHSCYQVLAQDCTQELKFIVLLKRDHTHEQNHINVKIADIDVELYQKNNAAMVNVNGVEIPIINLPYHHPTGKIQIRQKGEGIVLHAPSHGLQEVYFDLNALKVKVADWMRGQTCGLCGKADGEIREEYQTPNERVTKDAVSYAHSWVLPSQSCRDAAECFMKLESVKLEKQVNLHGQESKCYSVEPVLRCLPGCMPIRTTTVKIGYHCLPTDSTINRSESLNGIYEKSVDLREKTEAHLACRCTSQCA